MAAKPRDLQWFRKKEEALRRAPELHCAGPFVVNGSSVKRCVSVCTRGFAIVCTRGLCGARAP